MYCHKNFEPVKRTSLTVTVLTDKRQAHLPIAHHDVIGPMSNPDITGSVVHRRYL